MRWPPFRRPIPLLGSRVEERKEPETIIFDLA